MLKKETSMKISDSSPHADFKKIFLFSIPAMHEKTGNGKATEILSHIDRRDFEFVYEKISDKDGLKRAASDYTNINKAFKSEFNRPAKPEGSIKRVVNDTTIDPENIFFSAGEGP